MTEPQNEQSFVSTIIIKYTEYTDTPDMGTKTISIKDEAYERLRKFKREGESFTDLINRLTRKRSLLELPELVEKEEAESLEKAIEKSSEERKKARKRELEA